MSRIDARQDTAANKSVYWWAFTDAVPENDSGWSPLRKDKMVVAKCKFKGVIDVPRTASYYTKLLSQAGKANDGFWKYMWEISYGTVDLDVTMSSAWRTMDVNVQDFMKIGIAPKRNDRNLRVKKCIDTWGYEDSDFKIKVALVNAPSEVGAHGSWALFDPGNDHQNMVAHELGHAYGLYPHSFDKARMEYQDGFDIMGGMPNYSYEGEFGRSGVGMHAHHLRVLGFLPAHRIKTLTRGPTPKTATYRIAALTRPEAKGHMLLEVVMNAQETVVVEMREKHGWDRNLPQAGVIIRALAPHPDPASSLKVTYLQDDVAGPVYTQGKTFVRGTMTVKVKSLSLVDGSATVEVKY